MCEECLQFPCHHNCPNAPDPPIVTYCRQCNTPIRVYDEYLSDGDYNYCEWDCVKEYYFKNKFIEKKIMNECDRKEV